MMDGFTGMGPFRLFNMHVPATPCTLVFHLIQGQGTEPRILREREASKTRIQTCNLSVLRPFSRPAVISIKLNKGNPMQRSIMGPIHRNGGWGGGKRERERERAVFDLISGLL